MMSRVISLCLKIKLKIGLIYTRDDPIDAIEFKKRV